MKAFVEKNYLNGTADLYISDNIGEITRYYHIENNNVIATETKSYECDVVPIKPIISLPLNMISSFISSIVDLSKNYNIHAENDNLLQGKLQATENHLKDISEINKKLVDFITKC